VSSDLSPTLRQALTDDQFSAWIGATLDEARPGFARMSLTVRPEQCGPHGLTHGGTVMALAEAALAAATHAYNRVHLALNVNVTFHSATRPGDRLTATVEEQRAGNRTGGYAMTVTDQEGTLVATCQAVVYRTREPLVDVENGE
jgi:acyl-CoA thioesterase